MKITEVQITPIKPCNGLLAFASVVLDSCLYLGSIGVHGRRDGTGYRITYPTKKVGGRDMNFYHPINRETSRLIEDAITDQAKEVLS